MQLVKPIYYYTPDCILNSSSNSNCFCLAKHALNRQGEATRLKTDLTPILYSRVPLDSLPYAKTASQHTNRLRQGRTAYRLSARTEKKVFTLSATSAMSKLLFVLINVNIHWRSQPIVLRHWHVMLLLSELMLIYNKLSLKECILVEFCCNVECFISRKLQYIYKIAALLSRLRWVNICLMKIFG